MILEVLQHNIGEVEATAKEALEDLIEEEEEGNLTCCNSRFCGHNVL